MSPLPRRRLDRLDRLALATALALTTALATGGCATEATSSPLPTTTSTSTSTTSTTAPTTTTVAPTPTTAAPVDLNALQPPAAAGDPGGLAVQIATAEATLRDPASPEPAVATAALAQQVAYRQLGRHPEWDAAVIGGVPVELQQNVQRNAEARREFGAMHRTLATTLPAWRIVAPEPFDALVADYREAEAAFGIPWMYLAAIHLVETGTGRIRGTSTAGAQGPMQFLPATWAAYGAGGDINSTHDSIMAAGRYLAANGGAANLTSAIWNYNHSDHYVRGVILYAQSLSEYPEALRAYYHWGVWYLTAQGEVYLPVGYERDRRPTGVADQINAGARGPC